MPAARFNRLCACCCTQHLTHTGNYSQLFPLSDFDLAAHWHVPKKGVGWALLSTYVQFDPSCCWTNIGPPFPACISPFTHDSCVMSTICQNYCIDREKNKLSRYFYIERCKDGSDCEGRNATCHGWWCFCSIYKEQLQHWYRVYQDYDRELLVDLSYWDYANKDRDALKSNPSGLSEAM